MSKVTYVKNTPGIVLSASNIQNFLDQFLKTSPDLQLTTAQVTAVNDILSDKLTEFVEDNAIVIPASLNDNIHALADSYAGTIPPTLSVTVVPPTK